MTDRSGYKTFHSNENFKVTYINNTRKPGIWLYHKGMRCNIVVGAKDESTAYREAIDRLSEEINRKNSRISELYNMVSNINAIVATEFKDDYFDEDSY